MVKELGLTRSLREPGGPCTKSMGVSESRMQRVNELSISCKLLAGRLQVAGETTLGIRLVLYLILYFLLLINVLL